MFCICIMPPPLIGGGIKRCFCAFVSFVWRLSVAYIGPNSRTDRPMTKIGTEVAHVIRDLRQWHHFQGHQAAFLTAALTCEAGERWPWERIGRGKLLLRCVCSAAREAPTGGEAQGHIVSPRAQLVGTTWPMHLNTDYNQSLFGRSELLLYCLVKYILCCTSVKKLEFIFTSRHGSFRSKFQII